MIQHHTKYGSGKVGELADGTKVVVRPGCSDGVDTPTLEIQEKNGNRIKVRYKN